MFADGGATASVSENLPGARIVVGGEKQPFPLAAGPRPMADKPGRHHPRVVHHDQITGPQHLGKIANMPVGQAPAGPAYMQQPRIAAPRERLLGDQLFGEPVIVEIGL